MATTLDAARVSASPQLASSLSRLRAELSADRAVREALIANHAMVVAELTGHSDSDSILEKELADDAIARSSEAIREIDAAFERMDAGTYGLCETCRGEIPLERLLAIPQARLCVACSERRSSVLGSA